VTHRGTRYRAPRCGEPVREISPPRLVRFERGVTQSDKAMLFPCRVAVRTPTPIEIGRLDVPIDTAGAAAWSTCDRFAKFRLAFGRVIQIRSLVSFTHEVRAVCIKLSPESLALRQFHFAPAFRRPCFGTVLWRTCVFGSEDSFTEAARP